MLPGVSCACITFGRVNLLEESMESFLKQQYRGPKEMVILNDFAMQTLYSDLTYVRAFNHPLRFKTLGEKRNHSVKLCKHNWVAYWDDDDIALPGRLTNLMEYCLKNNLRGAIESNMLCFYSSKKIEYTSTMCQSLLIRKDLFWELGGFAPMNVGEDADFIYKAMKHKDFGVMPVNEKTLTYVYRWQTTGNYHVSTCGYDKACLSRALEIVKGRVKGGKEPSGRVDLKPHWDKDYIKMVDDWRATSNSK